MMTPRKITLQLTPLLDLLLIVFFAQYLEVRSQTAASTQQLANVHEERRREKEEASLQRDEILRLLSRLFAVPAADLHELSRHWEGGMAGPTAQRVQSRLDQLAQSRGTDVIHHLLVHEELQKRCDSWDVYIDDADLVTVTAGDRIFEFRASTADECETRLIEVGVALPQPKLQVVLLLSYGDAKFGVRTAMQEGMRRAADQLRRYHSDLAKYEYAVLGYRPRSAVMPANQ